MESNIVSLQFNSALDKQCGLSNLWEILGRKNSGNNCSQRESVGIVKLDDNGNPQTIISVEVLAIIFGIGLLIVDLGVNQLCLELEV